jgi:hypothetical protein
VSLEEDLLLGKVATLEKRVDALEAIVTYPKGKVADVSGFDQEPGTETISTEPPAEDRAECPLCGKEVAVNKDGSLRKHKCEPE